MSVHDTRATSTNDELSHASIHFDSKLASVIQAWPTLQPHVRETIDLLVRTSAPLQGPSGNTAKPNVQRESFQIFSTSTASVEVLTKTILFLLRHSPESGGLCMDSDGWIDIHELQNSLEGKLLSNVSSGVSWFAKFLIQLQIRDRIQIRDGKIRAAYGHSTPQFSPSHSCVPSDCLFHGTSSDCVPLINAFGLHPGKRRFVQLTTDHEYAANIRGQSLVDSTAVFQVMTSTAIETGVRFFPTGTHVWLASHIPSECLQLWMNNAPNNDDVFSFFSDLNEAQQPRESS